MKRFLDYINVNDPSLVLLAEANIEKHIEQNKEKLKSAFKERGDYDNPNGYPVLGDNAGRFEVEHEKLGNEQLSFLHKTVHEVDPSPTKDHGKWIINKYIKGEISLIEDIPTNLHVPLRTFHSIKNKKNFMKMHNLSSDINSYGYSEFLEKMGDIEGKAARETGKFPNTGYETIHSTPDLDVHKITSKAGACYWGQGTRWCTRHPADHAMFQGNPRHDPYVKYTSDYSHISDEPLKDNKIKNSLFIYHDKKNNEVYQYSPSAGQFMDKNDDEPNPITLLQKNIELISPLLPALHGQVMINGHGTQSKLSDNGISQKIDHEIIKDQIEDKDVVNLIIDHKNEVPNYQEKYGPETYRKLGREKAIHEFMPTSPIIRHFPPAYSIEKDENAMEMFKGHFNAHSETHNPFLKYVSRDDLRTPRSEEHIDAVINMSDDPMKRYKTAMNNGILSKDHVRKLVNKHPELKRHIMSNDRFNAAAPHYPEIKDELTKTPQQTVAESRKGPISFLNFLKNS